MTCLAAVTSHLAGYMLYISRVQDDPHASLVATASEALLRLIHRWAGRKTWKYLWHLKHLIVSQHHTILFQHRARTLSSIPLDQTRNWENGKDNTFLTIWLYSIRETIPAASLIEGQLQNSALSWFYWSLQLANTWWSPDKMKIKSTVQLQIKKAVPEGTLLATNHNVLWDLTFKTASVFRTLSLSVTRQELETLWDKSWAVSEGLLCAQSLKDCNADTGIRDILFFHCQQKGKLSIEVRDNTSWIWKVQPKGENSLLQKTHFVLALPESIKIHPYFFPGDANSWG